MAIQGEKRERQQQQTESVKKVGLFEARVVAINPTNEEFKEMFGIDLPEDSKLTTYLGTKPEGHAYLRIDVWLEEVKDKEKFKLTFFLEDKIREDKDFTKKQYINTIGKCAWATDPNNLDSWFTNRDYRVAFVGEEDFYEFLRTWLEFDYRKPETDLSMDWKRLMKGDVRELKNQIGADYTVNIGALAAVEIKEKDGEYKEYQKVFHKAFLPAYYLKNFNLKDVNYNNTALQQSLRNKKPSELKPYERFVVKVTGDYGCKHYFTLRSLQEYNPNDNLVASNSVLSSDGSDF
jgi:hypothetical protein